MADRPIFTYQTRLALDAAADAALTAGAELYGRAERSLFAALQSGKPRNDIKRAFLVRFGISGRQFNAARVSLEGKIDSINERRPGLIQEAQTRIAKATKVIAKLEKKAAGTNKLHQKKRRLAALRHRLEQMQHDHAAGVVRLCFGSRKLFRAQFDLEANGYTDQAAWRTDWQSARNGQWFVLGSQDESAGNQLCQATLSQDGSITLQLRLPDALSAHGTHLTIAGVRFAYGHEQLVYALRSSRRVDAVTKDGKPVRKRIGTAISYRFVRDDKGWRVFASVEAAPVVQVTHRLAGAVGVDVNADHLAVAQTDRFGNLIGAYRLDLPLMGKTTDQRLALIGDAVNRIAQQATNAGKPVVIEKLDFQKKKAELEAIDPAQARMLSAFACNKILSGLKAACFRHGVEVIEINPAYTSVIGAVNTARVRGVSVHQGAAYAIARRGLGLSETPVPRPAVVPVRTGGHVTFALPVRNRAKHEWTHWAAIRTRLRAALAAHYRSGIATAQPAPLSPEMRALSAYRSSPAKLRGANRSQHCSESVMDDVPY